MKNSQISGESSAGAVCVCRAGIGLPASMGSRHVGSRFSPSRANRLPSLRGFRRFLAWRLEVGGAPPPSPTGVVDFSPTVSCKIGACLLVSGVMGITPLFDKAAVVFLRSRPHHAVPHAQDSGQAGRLSTAAAYAPSQNPSWLPLYARSDSSSCSSERGACRQLQNVVGWSRSYQRPTVNRKEPVTVTPLIRCGRRFAKSRAMDYRSACGYVQWATFPMPGSGDLRQAGAVRGRRWKRSNKSIPLFSEHLVVT